MRYVTSMPLIYNEVFIALYDRLKELKEKGKEIYFSCSDGKAAGEEKIQEFNEFAPGAGYGDVFAGVIGYSGGREKSGAALTAYAKENGIDAGEFIFVTNSDNEHQALNEANIHCVNIHFYDRDNLLNDWDKLLPS